MLFNSFPFLALLTATLLFYYLPFFRSFQVSILIFSSFFFYAWHAPWLLSLLAFSIAVNAIASWKAGRGERRHAWVWALGGVVANLCVLFFFKYAGLIGRTLGWNPQDPGASLVDTVLTLPLPIGISFFTFQGISLVVDTWKIRRDGGAPFLKSDVRPWEWFRQIALFKSFFPQLIAGPIVKARDFIPQVSIKSMRDIPWFDVLRYLALGYFFKMVLADNLKDHTFWMVHYSQFSGVNLAGFLFGYSMQIFADFAGYSSIALGLAALFGYRFPINFDWPYISASLGEFWKRWHISLSQWLREYLYFSLGGNRRGPWRTRWNLIAVMGLGGLWHGASWNYLVWGLLHGAGLVAEKAAGDAFPLRDRWPLRLARMGLVFAFVSVLWLTFVFPAFSDTLGYLKSMVSNLALPVRYSHLIAIAVLSLPVVLLHLVHLLPTALRERPAGRNLEAVSLGLAVALILTCSGNSHAFIYFQF